MKNRMLHKERWMRNTEIREQLQVTSLNNQIKEYGNKLEQLLHRMNAERMPKYLSQGQRYLGRSKKRKDRFAIGF